MNSVSLPTATSVDAARVDHAQAEHSSSPSTWVRIVLFCSLTFGFMGFSLLGWAFDKNKLSPYENRRYASFPHLKLSRQSIAAFPAAFDSYLNDRFPLRFQLTAMSNFLKWKVFGSSGHDDVFIGKDGWLFFLNAGNRAFLRHDLLTPQRLQFLISTFENRRRWLMMHHIKYLLVFVPCKCETYREKIPGQYKLLNADSIKEQLMIALKKYSKVDVIDLKKNLLSEKSHFEFPLYLVTDTHWNQLGAFVAYEAVAKRLQEIYPAIKPLQWQDVNFTSRRQPGGDLARMLGVGNYLSEKVAMVKIRSQHWVYSSHPPLPNLNSETGHYQPFATEVNNPSLPKAYFIRDSFTIYLQPFLSENFKRACFYWNYRRSKEDDFLPQEILNEHPDIVIQEMAENVLAMDAIGEHGSGTSIVAKYVRDQPQCRRLLHFACAIECRDLYSGNGGRSCLHSSLQRSAV